MKKAEISFDIEEWKKKYLFPFALDPTPLRFTKEVNGKQEISKMTAKGDILTSGRFQFPQEQVFNFNEFKQGVGTPIAITIRDIMMDLLKFTKDFPNKFIPHISSQDEIIDMIHNYKRKKPSSKQDEKDTLKPTNLPYQGDKGKNSLALESVKPSLKEEDINRALKEIYTERTARLIGLLSHICYWSVYGHFNDLPLDEYHRKQLFVNIAQI